MKLSIIIISGDENSISIFKFTYNNNDATKVKHVYIEHIEISERTGQMYIYVTHVNNECRVI